ncbi:MAG: hypothetical protein ABSH47_27835, partial [Bryobacteraceae bacterium]
MECEMAGRVEEAAWLFRKAWEQSSDDFESFAARHKTTAIDSLRTGDEGGLRGRRRLRAQWHLTFGGIGFLGLSGGETLWLGPNDPGCGSSGSVRQLR